MCEHFNYILFSHERKYQGSSYVGYTNHPVRRIRQHNGELVGGAKFTTRRDASWKFLIIIGSPNFNRISALSSEWHICHPNGARRRNPKFDAPHARINSLEKVICHEKFKTFSYVFYVNPQFLEYAQAVFSEHPRVKIALLDMNLFAAPAKTSIGTCV